MKKSVLLILVGVLIVAGGLFYIFSHNQNSASDRNSETNSSPNPKAESQTNNTNKNETANSASNSTTMGSDQKSSSGQSEGSSSSISTQSSDSKADQSSSENSSTSSDSTTTTDKSDQAVNRPNGAWVETFEKELYKGYHVTPSRYKSIGNGNWEVWVKEVDTGENPYVTVNQNTGDFHG